MDDPRQSTKSVHVAISGQRLMRLHILGVRGSTPAPGRDFLRYGGHTSCVAFAHDGQAPSLIIDAGTGIRNATSLLSGQPFVGTLLLGHLHWDHTQGLPFFGAGDTPGARVALYAPAQPGHEDMEAVLARAMSPPHFPIPPKGLRGHWAFNSLEEGEAELEGFSFLALEIPHKGSRTFGYRVSDGRVAVAYLSDHWPLSLGAGPSGLGEYHEAALRLVDGCDIVFHDAQYTDQELPAKAYLGHSSHGYALGLAQAARARSVLFFHHDPSRTDAELDQIVEHYRGAAAITVDAAAEGRTIKL